MNIPNMLGGRKAAAVFTGLIVVVGVFLVKGSLPAELVDAVKFLVTTYVTGNIAGDLVDGVSEKLTQQKVVESKPSTDPAVESAIRDLGSRLNEQGLALQTQAGTIQQIVQVLSQPQK